MDIRLVAYFVVRQKKNMCVSGYISKKIRVGRSLLIYIF